MFERFTERARQVIVLAQEEARVLHHTHIGTEHLLLGLLREQEGVAAQALAALGVTLEDARTRVRATVGVGDHATHGQIPFTPRAKRVLELALREARALAHGYIGTEHLLLGLVREESGVASRILLAFGADAERVRAEVAPLLGRPGGLPGAPRLPGRRPPGPGTPPLDWRHAQLLWRPEGLELRVPLRLDEGAMARFAADEVWADPALAGLRREIWAGWVALASPTLLDDVDPEKLRRALDGAVARATAEPSERAAAFLRALREGPERPQEPPPER